MCYRLDRLTYDGTGFDLEVDNFNWIEYIKIDSLDLDKTR